MRQMRESGKTYQEIADHYGVSRQCIQQHLGTYSPNKFIASSIRPVIYEGLREWMLKNKVGYTEMIRRIGKTMTMPPVKKCMREKLTGRIRLSISDVDDILRVTGLTYEEAFRRA
ncbi:hypothetical protein SDC9_188162 [bioreactor metagenome]|uniref:Uncharacterized protein n=1 Tax=bioreactor metagenome TaxID=1076179 RepID=A0A645HWQ8_9ZZZZ